jgi:hypothetical protein
LRRGDLDLLMGVAWMPPPPALFLFWMGLMGKVGSFCEAGWGRFVIVGNWEAWEYGLSIGGWGLAGWTGLSAWRMVAVVSLV